MKQNHHLQHVIKHFAPNFELELEPESGPTSSLFTAQASQLSSPVASPPLYIKMMLVNDFARFKMFGNVTESRTAAMMNIVNILYQLRYI